MIRSNSSKAGGRVRTAWFLVIVDAGGSKELHIGWKYYDRSIGLFSGAGKSSRVRPPWGCVIDCSFETLTNGRKETSDYFKFQNRSFERKTFKVAELNPVLWEVNQFTSQIIEMRNSSKEKLLGLYLSLLPKSLYFSHHKEGIYDELGFKIDQTGTTSQTLEENGGSKEEYKEFVKLALDSALVVVNRREIVGKLAGDKKRKAKEDVPVKIKLSKVEKANQSKTEELTDKEGLEQEFKQKFIGRADIGIGNLSVSPKVSIPIIPFKVKGLVDSFLAQFDPTQICLMVTPVGGKPFNPTKLEENCYEVFHGRHRIMALKKILEMGKWDQLVGMDTQRITCHIVNITCPIQANFGACRGNDIQSKYVRKPHLHELIFVMEGIRMKYEKVKCQETMIRYGKLLSFGADDLTALNKFGNWSQGSLTDLSNVFKLYQSCKTSDAIEIVKRKSSQIMKGEVIAIPNNLFRKLAKVDEEHFKEMAPKVINRELSLKDLVERFSKVESRRHTESLIQQELGFKSVDDIHLLYADKFNDQTLDTFAGAVIDNNSRNKKGAALQEYCISVAENPTEAVPKVLYKVVDNSSEFDLSSVLNYQTIVINIKNVTKDVIDKLDYLKFSRNEITLVLLFVSETELLKFEELAASDAVKNLNLPRRIYFLKEKPKERGEFCENLTYCLFFSIAVYKPPLKSFNGPINNLQLVVDQVSPPAAKLAFFNEGNMRIISVHLDHCCQYIGEKAALNRFGKELGDDKRPEVDMDENDSVQIEKDTNVTNVEDSGQIEKDKDESEDEKDDGDESKVDKDKNVSDDEESDDDSIEIEKDKDDSEGGKGDGDQSSFNKDLSQFYPLACSSFQLTNQMSSLEDYDQSESDESGDGDDEIDSRMTSMEVDTESYPVSILPNPYQDMLELDLDRYSDFLQLLERCFSEEGNAESLELEVINSFFSKLQMTNPFLTREIEACLHKMLDDEKVIWSDNTIYMII